MKLSDKRKAFLAALGGVCTALAPVIAGSAFGASSTGQLVAALLVAVGTGLAVYRVPNAPQN
jgi:hypothetical protein